MFSAAYQVARNFTRPVALSWRKQNGQVECGLATFIVVNKQGWVITAAHVLTIGNLRAQHDAERAAYEEKRKELDNPNISSGQRKKLRSSLFPNPEWITDHSFWWCQDGATASSIFVDAQADMAVAKLENFDTTAIPVFPRNKDTASDPPPACSLCRLGFPFVNVTASFNQSTRGFTLENFVLPPMFPNDGMHTRIMIDNQNGRTVKFIETSTPGLRGQSGGPLFDVKGDIWGVQSRTSFLELGFTPTKKEGNKEIVEHQFLNVGMAGHVQHAVELFKQHNVAYDSA